MYNKTPNEVELLQACVQGDTAAFEAIVTKYQSLICAITFSATADVEASEDLAQKAFIKAWTHIGQLKDLTKFKAWLRSITRNIIKDYFRKTKRDIVSSAASLEDVEEARSQQFKPVETLIDKEQQAVIRQALEQIPIKYREPLVLFYREGCSAKQVAEELELSEVTVKTRVSRGRKMLRQQVAAMVETTLKRTAPSKVFTSAVIASVSGLAIKGSSVAAAVGAGAAVSTAASTGGTATGAATIMSGITAKVVTVAAAAVIGAGAIVTYKQVTKPEPSPDRSRAEMVSRQQEERKEEIQETTTPQEQTGEIRASVVKEVSKSEGTRQQNHDVINEADTGIGYEGIDTNIPEASDESTVKTGISGIVVDKITSKPIEGAELYYGGQEEVCTVFTDANGHFEFSNMEAMGDRFVYVISKDYVSRRIIVDVIENKMFEDFKIELTKGGKAAGTVFDENGKPVEGATVKTFHFTNHPVITRKDGKFEIDGLDPGFGSYSLHVTHPNYPAISTTFSPPNIGESTYMDAVLKPGVTVYGQVMDEEGNPIADVDVGNTTSRAMWNCIESTTDDEGRYELKNVDFGELVLWAIDNRYAPYVERFSLDESEKEKLINIRLSTPVSLYGRVVDKQGNPVPDVTVSIREYKGVSNLAHWQDRVESDYDGRFVIPNAPPTGTVILSVWSEEIPNTHPEIETSIEKEHVITVDRVGKVYGKVLNDQTGEPIRSFNVKMTFSKKGYQPGWGYAATWNREGHNFDSTEGLFDTGWDHRLPIGAEYSMTVFADGFDPLTIDPVVVQEITEEPNRVEFRLKEETSFAGRVVDSNGVPIAGARIRFLTKDNLYEHWDDRDTTVTNSSGEFSLGGVGGREGAIHVTAEYYAPYLAASGEVLKDSEGPVKIVLAPEAGIYGRVIDANGNGMSGAKVSAHIFSEQMRNILNASWSSPVHAYTDTEGYYELFNLPEGDFSVSLNSSTANGNLNIAQKKITLEAGKYVELNFGNEEGFEVKGAVRIGSTPVEKASVMIRLDNESTKWGYSDNKGRFLIKGVPKGTYQIYTTYNLRDPSGTYISGPGNYLQDGRSIEVENDVELDIIFGDGSAAGKIPEKLMGMEDLVITARQWVSKTSENGNLYGSIQPNWRYASRGKVDSDGSFKIVNLREGRYYLLLSTKENETLGISDVFELGESEQLEDVTINLGKGVLNIHVIDSETLEGIPNARFSMKNNLDAIFYSRKYAVEGSRSGMTTTEDGSIEYADLPRGKYLVFVQVPGYVAAESEWIDVNDSKIKALNIPLERAAIVRFEMSQQLKEKMTTGYVYLLCRITDIESNELLPQWNIYGELEEHRFLLAPEELLKNRQPEINLPEGRYEIAYRLYQNERGYRPDFTKSPLFEGTVNVEITKGETLRVEVAQ